MKQTGALAGKLFKYKRGLEKCVQYRTQQATMKRNHFGTNNRQLVSDTGLGTADNHLLRRCGQSALRGLYQKRLCTLRYSPQTANLAKSGHDLSAQQQNNIYMNYPHL